MPKEIIRPTNVHEPMGYSHAAKVGNTIYTSGQVSKDLENGFRSIRSLFKFLFQTIQWLYP